ncbi:MAG: nicotinate-nucleotide adenylyltransferase [Candidatus Aminicenantales bacterium]
MTREKIGIFGGTFNPIHMGHIQAALEVQRAFSLDKVLFIPSRKPPHKKNDSIAPAHHRMAMVERALLPYPVFVPSSVEIEARGPSYSIRTLRKLKKAHPGAWIFFILGVDAFLEINTWRDYDSLLEACHFIVISRPGYRLDEAKKVLGGKYAARMIPVSGQAALEEGKSEDMKIFLLRIRALDISAHEIRQKIRTGEPISKEVPKPVADYIRDHRLYQRNR